MADERWTLLRQGRTELGIRLMRESFDAEATPSTAMELGNAYLFVRDYQAAWEHFDEFNRSGHSSADVFLAMAGTAQWCMNLANDAVATWHVGVSAEYTDLAGGITTPLLLYFASSVQSDQFSGMREEILELLRSRVQSRFAKRWPGPIAEYSVGHIDETALQARWESEGDAGSAFYRWWSSFYIGLRELEAGRTREWSAVLRNMLDMSNPEWSNERYFLRCVWRPEFFLARHEAEKLGIPGKPG
jgi:hypothetical protein